VSTTAITPRRTIVLFAVFLGFAFASLYAQDTPRNPAPVGAAIPPSNPPAVLTGKERLGRKWMDEQRIDNCNVPIDRRGTKPRSISCHHIPAG
jgi:hypothetical protein